ncbi:hypothetical protein GPECTOR_49g510 [Gonium pectorale]|uniref:Protein kinase domain-containing protein n=1 Tax=Gonium pectorale TaxID=33097 RepID=A0A150G7T1_GONPE|nr:hypothetical protein GPECTOR_49g510 [Gonium pectorale]|eukprot:KXZ45926.1 hypothetical protein GPECTOR_49g510 [Gonium pectorale]
MGLICHDVAVRALSYGVIDEELALSILMEIDARVTTSTRKAIRDGWVGTAGHITSDKGAGAYYAKAYTAGAAALMEHEKAVSDAVHSDQACPTLIKVLDAFHARRHAVLVLPLMARSAVDLLAAASPGAVDDEAAAYVAAGVLVAMAGLAAKGWCHGDIKPANIMLAAGDDFTRA